MRLLKVTCQNSITGGGSERLKLIRSKINSGTPNAPRNRAMKMARGEYLMFVDADDAITKTALEEVYPIAKKFNADVVHCEKHFELQEKSLSDNQELKTRSIIKRTNFAVTPTLFTENIFERISIFSSGDFTWTTYTNFVRRDFILDKGIEFPNLKMGGDFVFAVKL